MKSPDSDVKAGIYITVIFHLTVLIILLLFQIGAALRKDNSFVIDFSKQEEVEKIQKEEQLKEDISKKIEDMLAAYQGVPVRNIAVDRSTPLKDDRNTDAKQLYEDAERLQKELNAGVQNEDPDDYVATSEPDRTPKEQKTREQAYSGPSVVSYELEGRKASHLSIPAYRCMGSGGVTVIITVDNQGRVIGAKVKDDLSSDDACLRNFAVRAARLSRFSVSPTAPPRQTGNIVYAFIAQ